MKFYCVTGMHRTGTSVVAGLLNLLGAHLGVDDELLEPGNDNPRGYWERIDVLRVNEKVLRHLGASWDQPPTPPQGWGDDSALAPLRREAARAIAALTSTGASSVVVKDPRFAITAPFWSTLVSFDRVILPLRSPRDVALSLENRDGILPEHSARLWLRYVAGAAVMDERPPVVLSFDDVVRHPAEVARGLAASLDLADPSDKVLEAIQNFVDPELDHHASKPAPTGPVLGYAEQIHRELVEGQLELPKLRGLLAILQASPPRTDGAPQHPEVQKVRKQLSHVQGEQRRLEADRAARRLEVEFLRARVRRLLFDVQVRERRNVGEEGGRGPVPDQQQEIAKQRNALQERVRRAERDLVRLRSRRSVRVALAVANRFRPLFRAVRQTKKERAGNQNRGDRNGTDKSKHVQSDRKPDSPVRRSGTVSTPAYTTLLSKSPFENFESRGPVTVVIPVHDAVNEVRECLESVLRWTRHPHAVVVVDDASQEEETRKYLDEIARSTDIVVLRNEQNLGFSGAVNRGIQWARGDVVVLNSDTVVGPLWLRNLTLTAYASEDIGTVTAVSNDAGAFSVPVRGVHNHLPPDVDVADAARRFTQQSLRLTPDTPTANGFCMFLRRGMLDDAGMLDADRFPRGYGEENDLSMRASARGWRHVIDDRTYVYHHGSRSFAEEKDDLIHRGIKLVGVLHPEYPTRVREFLASPEMQRVRSNSEVILEGSPARPRVLHLGYGTAGGLPKFINELSSHLGEDFDAYALDSDGETVRLLDLRGDEPVIVRSVRLEEPVRFGAGRHAEYESFFLEAVDLIGAELVHLQHLMHHPTDALDLARRLGLPVMATIHDYYLTCPTIQLLDDHMSFCGATCTTGLGQCRVGSPWVRRDLPPLKHRWVHVWRSILREQANPAIDVFVAPSRSARDVFVNAFPEVAGRTQIVEHGVPAMKEVEPHKFRSFNGRPLRCLALGNLGTHKGVSTLRDIARLDEDAGEIELHLLGHVPTSFSSFGIRHGEYAASDVFRHMASIDPDVVLVLSPWGETYCYALSEAWQYGVPAVVADVGALAERVTETGAGWIAPPNDASAVYRLLVTSVRDPTEYGKRQKRVAAVSLPSVRDMADRYKFHYDELLGQMDMHLGQR